MRPDVRAGLLAGVVLLLAGCAGATLSAPTGEPVPDPGALAASVRAGAIPAGPRQLNVGWTLDERGSRVRGRGVVRVEAPRRIRLDLFGPRGETYLIAALVDGEYRLPPAVASSGAPLPSAALLWAALGILDPPAGSVLTGGTRSATGIDLRYESASGEIFAYTFHAEGERPATLVRLERAGRQGVLETVALDRDDAGGILRARYRDWSNFRDLTLETESERGVDSFPSTIWRPDVATQ